MDNIQLLCTNVHDLQDFLEIFSLVPAADESSDFEENVYRAIRRGRIRPG